MPDERKSMRSRNLKDALDACRSAARNAFSAAEPIYERVEKSLISFDRALARAKRAHNKLDDEKDKALNEAVGQLVGEQRQVIKDGFLELKDAQRRRKGELDDFNVMLFGRTMAGKSTTIEALTDADERSIGQGAPDFTRDIQGKVWEGLSLVDTPGLLGFTSDLTDIAESYIDRADLICMVLTDDTIEPTLFKKMKEVRGQNKRLLVLLNWKAANEPILDDEPEDAYDEDDVKAQIAEIRRRLAEVFPGEEAPVIHYCANAAFEARRATGERQRYLWEQSRMDAVLDEIARIVHEDGRAIRATAPFDGLMFFVQSIADDLHPQLVALRPQKKELERKQREAHRLFENLRAQSASELSTLKQHFLRVNSDLHEVAWEYARGERTESLGSALERAMDWPAVMRKINDLKDSVADGITHNLEHFQETVETDLEAVGSLALGGDFNEPECDRSRAKSASRWEKAGKIGKYLGMAAFGAVALAGGWWIVAGLAGGAAARYLGNKAIKHGKGNRARHQREIREEMKDKLWDTYRSLNDELYDWLQRSTNNAEEIVIKTLREIESASGLLLKHGDTLYDVLQEARHELSRESYRRLLNELHPAFCDGRVELIDASQWMQYRAKIVVAGAEKRPIAGLVIGKGGELIRPVRRHTGVPIDVIEYPPEGLCGKVVADALRPARVASTAVEVGVEIRVRVPKSDARHVFGQRKKNLRLAEDVLGRAIRIETGGQDWSSGRRPSLKKSEKKATGRRK